MTDGYWGDGRLDYPQAFALVQRYVAERSDDATTCVDVLRWSEHANTEHNRRRIAAALGDVGEQTTRKRSGRIVYDIPHQ